MRKYWYYTYSSASGYGCGIYDSDNGIFDIVSITEELCGKYSKGCVIQNWHEISSEQYEKLRKYFEKSNK